MGPPGSPGSPGAAGRACWDLDGNGACDVGTEDADGSGDCDAADCTGAQGPSGVVAVLSFDDNDTSASLGGTVAPHCRTSPNYLAGPNEVAVMTMTATVTSNSAGIGSVLIAAAEVGDADGTTLGTPQLAVFGSFAGSSGVAHASVVRRHDLVEGIHYNFGVHLDGGVSAGGIACSGTVTIMRVAP